MPPLLVREVRLVSRTTRHLDFPAEPKTEGEKNYIERRTIELARQFAVPADVMKARLKLFAARRRTFRPTRGPYRR